MPIENPTASEISAFIAKHNLTREQFAALVPVATSTVYSWLDGSRNPPPMLTRALRDIENELENKN